MKSNGSAHTFWCVWREGSHGFTYQHHTREDADREAKRLAADCPGEKFFVMKSAAAFEAPVQPISKVKMLPPKTLKQQHADLDSEVPF